MILRVEAPHFVAGCIYDREGFIVHAAPILKWCVGWQVSRFCRYCARKGWTPRLMPTP